MFHELNFFAKYLQCYCNIYGIFSAAKLRNTVTKGIYLVCYYLLLHNCCRKRNRYQQNLFKIEQISLWSCCRWLWKLFIDFKIEMSTHFSNYFVLMSITLRSENDTTDVAKCWQKTKRDIKSYYFSNDMQKTFLSSTYA